MSIVHYSEVKDWSLVHFEPHEIACKCCGSISLTPAARAAMSALDQLRELMGEPLTVTSGYRCYYHNNRIGGAPASFHMSGMAFDIWTSAWPRHKLLQFMMMAGACGFRGFGLYESVVHIDTRDDFFCFRH